MSDKQASAPKWQTTLAGVDRKLAQVERGAAGAFCIALCILILLNIVVRTARIPVFWIDEIAVYAMVWMAFMASACAVQSSEHVAVDILTRKLPASARAVCSRASHLLIFLIGIVLIACAWTWFDPLTLLSKGGDTAVFSDDTLNFIYSEPTASFAAPKALFWLIMPVFSLSITFHAFVRLVLPTHLQNSPSEEVS